MGIYEDTKRELKSALSEIGTARNELNSWFSKEKERVSKEIGIQRRDADSWIAVEKNKISQEIIAHKLEMSELEKRLDFYRKSIDRLAQERQVGFGVQLVSYLIGSLILLWGCVL
ncbi:MAG: hypothetical protein DYH13_09625 [Alphaproteobacteria bacterium PRO2]|nr:hypothetical protein [Alphaproteobacteria bacterium PRO2]